MADMIAIYPRNKTCCIAIVYMTALETYDNFQLLQIIVVLIWGIYSKILFNSFDNVICRYKKPNSVFSNQMKIYSEDP